MPPPTTTTSASRHIWASRSAWPRSRRRVLRNLRILRCASKRYSAPVAISTHLAGRSFPHRQCAAPGRMSRIERRIRFGRNGKFRAELARLQDRAIGQFAAGDPGRKAEIVFDAHAAPGLTARRNTFDDQRAKPLAGAIHRGREPRRPAAHDHQVVDRLFPGFAAGRGAFASSRFDGFRKTSLVAQATTGVSFSVTPRWRRKSITCGSVSRSSQVNTERFCGQEIADAETCPATTARESHAGR